MHPSAEKRVFPSRWTLPLPQRRELFLNTVVQPKQGFRPSTGSMSEQVGFFGNVAVKTIHLPEAGIGRHDVHNARLANHIVNIQRYHAGVLAMPSPIMAVDEMETYHVAKTLSDVEYNRLHQTLRGINQALADSSRGLQRFWNKAQRTRLQQKQAQLHRHLSLQHVMRQWATPVSATSGAGEPHAFSARKAPVQEGERLLLFQKNLQHLSFPNEVTVNNPHPGIVNAVTRYIQQVGKTLGVWRVDVAFPVNGELRLSNVIDSAEGLHLLDPSFENVWRYAGHPDTALIQTPRLLKQAARRAIRFC